MKLTLRTAPEVPLEAEVISPATLFGKSAQEIHKLTLFYGNRTAELGEFFRVEGEANGVLELEGDLSRVKLIGSDMSDGQLIIDGDVGTHLGACMSGGEIVVNGNAGDWVGREMNGGRITIKGDAGHMVGSAVRGSAVGILGGEIIIHGNCRNEVGSGMRRGLIVIGGDSGDFTGVNMLAGTLVVLGRLGIRTGAGMRRGSIVSMNGAEMLPTFSYSCTYRPGFLRFYLNHLRQLGLPVSDDQMQGNYQRWCGDAIELNKGEILIYQA